MKAKKYLFTASCCSGNVSSRWQMEVDMRTVDMRTFGAVLFVFGVGVISIAVSMVAAAVSGGAGTVGMIDSMNTGPIVVPAFIAVIAGIPVAGAVFSGAGAIIQTIESEAVKTRKVLIESASAHTAPEKEKS